MLTLKLKDNVVGQKVWVNMIVVGEPAKGSGL
jgi:hypothetical protein